jgi:uncharacterized protein (TIGR02679 family)
MDENLVALFRSEELSWLVDRLAARIERGEPLDRGTAAQSEATPAQRRAIDGLYGRRSSAGRSLTVDLAGLAHQLALDAAGMRELVVAIRGPLTDRRARRDSETAAWTELLAEWRARLAGDPAGLRWLEGLAATGLLKRLAARETGTAQRLLDQCRAILAGAPHNDLLLASLAVQSTGDSHALDRGRPLGTLCLRAIAERHGVDGTANADARREAWAAIGVSLDDLSAPVLCLNLRAAPECDLAAWIAWHVSCGEPFYLPWRQVRRFAPDPAMDTVFVCENPALISEAANRLGPRCRPLVCLNGIPNAPAKALLRRLADGGIALRLRADFDWTGLRIVDALHDPPRSSPWRMTEADYRKCRPTQPLAGAPFEPAWGLELARAMERRGLAAYEEELVETLLDDLREADR